LPYSAANKGTATIIASMGAIFNAKTLRAPFMKLNEKSRL